MMLSPLNMSLSRCLALLYSLSPDSYVKDSMTSSRYKFRCLSNNLRVPLYSIVLEM